MIIDAVDECHSVERRTIFKILQDLVATSANVVKVFLTSREDERSITLPIFQSSVRTRVHEAIRDRRLLPGINPSKFQQKIIDTLPAESQGM